MNAADIAHTVGDARREARGWCCRCPLHGGRSVRLGMPRASEWLAIAEGIETTLSVAAACAVPGWAGLLVGWHPLLGAAEQGDTSNHLRRP